MTGLTDKLKGFTAAKAGFELSVPEAGFRLSPE